jgi:LacI family transcriptional regulator
LGKIPIIFLQREVLPQKSKYSSIDIDNTVGIEQALDHLFNAGHQHIAHINGLRRDGSEREEAFISVMKRKGLNPLVIEGDFTEECGVRAAKTLEDYPDITAVLCSNDQTALGLYQGLKTRGLSVPKDISVIGFDNEPWTAYMDPPLTTVLQPANEVGQRAARQVLEELSGKSSCHKKMPVSFVERQSVGKKD